MCYTILVFTAFAYGFIFGIRGQFILPQLVAPFAFPSLVIIWLLPDRKGQPTRILTFLTFAYVIALLCWPDYLALALPGIPWITATRLVVTPLLTVLLVSLSISPDLRRKIQESLSATPFVWKALVLFSVYVAMSTVFSKDPSGTFSKVIVVLSNWTGIYFVASLVFLKPGRASTLSTLLLAITIFVCSIGVVEAKYSQVPWARHIPSFLAVGDESVARILAGSARAATGIYRVQSKFTTSLGLGEFLGIALPFIMHIIITHSSKLLKLVAILSLPLILYIIIKTDSRLAAVGAMMSIMLYVLAWAALRWRFNKASIVGPVITLSFPAMLSLFVVSTFFVGRLRAIVWGNGAQAASTESRMQMYKTGIPMVLKAPWGHGFGQGAITLGFYNGDHLTIDTYYLAVALEVGIVGFILFYSIFIVAIIGSARSVLKTEDKEVRLLIPITIALTNFFIIKSVFSQAENHPLIFLLLGTATALIARQRAEIASKAPAGESRPNPQSARVYRAPVRATTRQPLPMHVPPSLQ